jgi:hypothetical protein
VHAEELDAQAERQHVHEEVVHRVAVQRNAQPMNSESKRTRR